MSSCVFPPISSHKAFSHTQGIPVVEEGGAVHNRVEHGGASLKACLSIQDRSHLVAHLGGGDASNRRLLLLY